MPSVPFLKFYIWIFLFLLISCGGNSSSKKTSSGDDDDDGAGAGGSENTLTVCTLEYYGMNIEYDPSTYYQDADNDDYGADNTAVLACDSPGSGYVDQGGDCDDTDANINPDAQDDFDGSVFTDNSCDGNYHVDDTALTAVLYGDQDDSDFAQSARGLGDVNGDGCDDFAVGAADYDTEEDYWLGRVYLMFGRGTTCATSGDYPSTADVIWTGQNYDYDWIGKKIHRLGDINGDRCADFAYTLDHDSEAMAVILGRGTNCFSNSAFPPVTAPDIQMNIAEEMTYATLAENVDLNGDGCQDIVIADPEVDNASHWDVGKIFIVYGKGTTCLVTTALPSSLAEADVEIVGKYRSANLGQNLANLGDVNADGCDDLLFYIESDFFDESYDYDRVVLLEGRGPTCRNSGAFPDIDNMRVLAQVSRGDAVDYEFSGAGDTNADGCDDFLVAIPGFETQPETETDTVTRQEAMDAVFPTDSGLDRTSDSYGRVNLVYGRASGCLFQGTYPDVVSAGDFAFYGEDAHDKAGQVVAPLGDVNADGCGDFSIMAGRQVYVIEGQGATCSDTSDYNWNLRDEGSYAFEEDFSSGAISGGFDLNADGFSDVLIGSEEYTYDGEQIGRISVFFGR